MDPPKVLGDQAKRGDRFHSHSMVAGGFELMS
jgi:hypothetical protein